MFIVNHMRKTIFSCHDTREIHFIIKTSIKTKICHFFHFLSLIHKTIAVEGKEIRTTSHYSLFNNLLKLSTIQTIHLINCGSKTKLPLFHRLFHFHQTGPWLFGDGKIDFLPYALYRMLEALVNQRSRPLVPSMEHKLWPRI